MGRRGTELYIGLLGLFVCARPAAAFSPEGHEAIEGIAYKELLARDKIPEAGVSGREVLAYLIRNGYLARPACFETKPDAEHCDDAARRKNPVEFWPILGTGAPDSLISRQFAKFGQCYHFMADSPDWRDSAKDPNAGVQRGLSHDAYLRCIRLATSIFDEILGDAYAARVRGRDLYTLMHMFGDSFSPAHVERTAGGTGKIRFLKSWVIRNWLLYFFDTPSFDKKVHHDLPDPRDKRYMEGERRVGGVRCADVVTPYSMPPACLSAEGNAAKDTLVDLLVTLYVVVHRDKPAAVATRSTRSDAAPLPLGIDSGEGGAAPARGLSVDDPGAHGRWQAFLSRHFESEYEPLVVRKQNPDEQEWQPNTLLSARYRPALGDETGFDVSLEVSAMQQHRRALPLIPMESFSLGYGKFADEGRWLSRAEMAFIIPIIGEFAIGFTPVAASLDCELDFASCHADLLTTPARLSYFSDYGFWLDLAGPEYSWIEQRWSMRVALRFGIAMQLPSLFRPKRHISIPTVERAWMPPPLPDKLITDPPWALVAYFEGGVADSDPNHFYGMGFELRRERNSRNKRDGFGYGIEAGYQHGAIDGRELNEGRLVPVVRYFFIEDMLALRLSPAALGAGSWGGDFRFDVGADAELALSISAFELAFCAPRFSYLHSEANVLTPFALRFSWRISD